MTMFYSPKHRAAAEAADYKCSELELDKWDHYGLEVYTDGHHEWAVGTDSEADEAAGEYVKNTAWAFNSTWLAEQTDLPAEVFSALQREKYEDANDTILKLIERSDDGIEGFIDASIEADGRGHFLAGYDSEEREVTISTRGQSTTFYVYRNN